MQRATATRRVAALLALGTLAMLTACSPLADGLPLQGESESQYAEGARESVAELVRGITRENAASIDVFARAAVAASASGSIILIDYQTFDAAELIDPLGELTFQVAVLEANAELGTGQGDGQGADASPYCFSVAFNYYGKASGAWETTEGIDEVECPDNATAVVPPPDETVRAVVAENSVEVTQRVLEDPTIGAALSNEDAADAIAGAITAELLPPAGEFTVVAEPSVLVDGARVGVAMGSADDCVLMNRVDGVVGQLSVPRVLFQPGELGCAPSTALAPAESLRSPH